MAAANNTRPVKEILNKCISKFLFVRYVIGSSNTTKKGQTYGPKIVRRFHWLRPLDGVANTDGSHKSSGRVVEYNVLARDKNDIHVACKLGWNSQTSVELIEGLGVQKGLGILKRLLVGYDNGYTKVAIQAKYEDADNADTILKWTETLSKHIQAGKLKCFFIELRRGNVLVEQHEVRVKYSDRAKEHSDFGLNGLLYDMEVLSQLPDRLSIFPDKKVTARLFYALHEKYSERDLKVMAKEGLDLPNYLEAKKELEEYKEELKKVEEIDLCLEIKEDGEEVFFEAEGIVQKVFV